MENAKACHGKLHFLPQKILSLAHKGIGYIFVLSFELTKTSGWIPVVVFTCHWYNINSLCDFDLQ